MNDGSVKYRMRRPRPCTPPQIIEKIQTMVAWIPRGLGNVSVLCVLAISMCLVWLFMNVMQTLDYPDAKLHKEDDGEGVKIIVIN